LLEEAGVAAQIREAGREVKEVMLHVAGAPPLRLELPSPALAVRQQVVEEALLTTLRSENVEVRTPHRAVTIEQANDHIDVRVMRRELVTLGSPAHYSEWEPLESSVVRASFVIGADGYESRVRTALGLELVKVGNTEAFAMFESENDGDVDSALHLCFDADSCSLMLPLPERKARWGFQINEGLDAEPDLNRLRVLQSRRAAWYEGAAATVAWGTVIHFERRLARAFGKHRVWLAGDAAHVTSPLGSQSMNAGLSEAHELANRMADALDGGHGLEDLEHCGAERAREWHKLLGVNVRLDLLPHAPEWLPAYARRLLPALPVSGADLTTVLERIGLRLS
jgi:2-polyprenyl-6-methoxyphenol hydroxylase-like FAD-dependent oxidoreductase